MPPVPLIPDLKDDNLPVPVSSIKEEEMKIDVPLLQDMPIRVYSVSKSFYMKVLDCC